MASRDNARNSVPSPIHKQMWARSQKRGKAVAFQTNRNTQSGFRRDGRAGGNGTRRRSVREIRTHTHTGCDSSVDPRVHVAAEEKRQPEIEEAPAKRSGNVVKNLVAG